MSREASITFEQVTSAANTIKAEGGKPTSRAVRDRLGSGSMGTVNKMLQDWKAGQERKIDTAVVLPAGLQRAILDFMDSELSSAKAKIMADLVDQQREAADLANENESQVKKIDDLLEIIKDREEANMKATGQIDQIHGDLVETKRQIKDERQAAEMARTELAKALLRLEAMPRLEADLVEVRKTLEIEHLARVQAEKTAAVFEATNSGLVQMLEEVKTVASREKAELVKTAEAMKTEIIELRKPKTGAVKKETVKKTQPAKKLVATTAKASKVGVTQAD